METVADFPELVAQWDWEKNGENRPDDYMINSVKKVFWICDKGPDHTWNASISSRKKAFDRIQRFSCPFCENRKLSVTNSLATRYSEIADEWHPTKNGDLTPDDLIAYSKKLCWWKCDKGPDHEWQAKIYNRTKLGRGCLFCSNRKVSITNSLATRFSEVAKQWHPTKNGNLTPNDVIAGSNTKYWWKCNNGLDHEWKTAVSKRTGENTGCPFCKGSSLSITNSLKTLYPEIAKEWHPTKNGKLKAEGIVANSGKKVWWKCDKGPDHEWKTSVIKRTGERTGCPSCANRKVSVTNSIAFLFPEVAKQWHPTKNGKLTANDAIAGSNTKYWWKCDKGPDHEWKTIANARTYGQSTCPFCAGRDSSVTNSIASLYPEIAKEWHPTKNDDLMPNKVVAGSNKPFWWKCDKGPDHEWKASPASRTKRYMTGCPYCANKSLSITNSLANTYPEIAKEWHPTKNGDLTPDKVTKGSERKYWWKCDEGPDHEWKASLANRTRTGIGCPYCAGKKVAVTNSLASLYPEIAKEWHPTKNSSTTPDQIVGRSQKQYWWICSIDKNHVWKTSPSNRVKGTGCPICNVGWSLKNVKVFIKSLLPYVDKLTPSELYIILLQNGIYNSEGKSKLFIKALSTGKLPIEELQKFVKDEPSIVDEIIEKELTFGEVLDEYDEIEESNTQLENDKVKEFPLIKTKHILETMDATFIMSSDEEAIEYLINSAKAKIWKHAFINEHEANLHLFEYKGEGYGRTVKEEFIQEYNRSTDLVIPSGYNFKINGKIAEPNLMQRFIAAELKTHHQLGNWSGTGAGKTLSAILASRVVDSILTLIICPNAVVEGWKSEINSIYPESGIKDQNNWLDFKYRYIVLNFEKFQLGTSSNLVKELTELPITMIVIDEVQFVKQRDPKSVSKRKQMIGALTTNLYAKNPDLYVLGMSATPVINNLQEGKSLIEMITGTSHDDLETRPSITNCMKLHQKLVTLGIRYIPEYDLNYEQLIEEIEISEYLDEIRLLGKGSPLKLEQVLTKARLPKILEHIKPKTLIYTYYVSEIDDYLMEEIERAGWSVGFYTGDDKTGLNEFINEDLDVLIGSNAISTGVDGLQRVCNQIIINILPWTNAEFEQLRGRVFRQGQVHEKVRLVIPITYAMVNGERWSWGDSKLDRIRYKKTIADAAVDGVIPEHSKHLVSPAKAYQNIMDWLKRLDEGKVVEIERERLFVPIPDDEMEKRVARYGDFSRMNHRWNSTRSDSLQKWLQEDRTEWENYHALYREARKTWKVVPFEEIIKWAKKREGYVIGDFGCGEALLARELADLHTVHSFDHVAINDEVIEGDMAAVPLEDGELDVAVFSLSLMGSNLTDYVREAHRCLRLDGYLHIIESSSRFKDLEGFVEGLEEMGFEVVSSKERGKFMFIRAIKSGECGDVELRF
ncbi:MAG: methyltransferase domain-containing protein [Candidatus Heimdallarchaeota archaeon]|nr:methyltransferase domain-containing protein [Candidatus Heimdallarchaeota archaeon]